MNNRELIDLFKNKKELKSDKDVAEVLNVDAGFFSALKNEKSPMPVPMKFKLLGCMEFTPDIHKIAACFVDIKEHIAGMQEVEDRIEEAKKKGQTIQKKYANQSEIDRLSQFMRKRKIDVEQTAKFLETTPVHIESVLNGDNVLSVTSKAMLYIANAGNNAIKKFIDLMPISDATKEAWKAANDEAVHKNLNARLKK